ncbi:SMI1/KNR4 family protein [[Limnothrix rosea] IAM M-220]|uniref:SMI1/KNR4 family protein n=1 Tax=[Limnothrix rosea] IAM M-220 TaxID=454133 RepID=UPI00095E052C|nr:SMI1/KNR4 family protein [[Limnothrix rosea] IAM M-220]OKH12684.1 hypothetical protein NIES208_15795 [[Limnothrix rosea] IAM M-220]
MYEWLGDFHQRCDGINSGRDDYFRLAPQGATAAELALVEDCLGVELSPSHRAFLSGWDGLDLMGSRIFSTGDILAGLDDIPFAPFEGSLERRSQDLLASTKLCGTYLYYGDMPAYQFICRSFDTTGIVYCLDTHHTNYGEYGVCKYDPEYDFEHHLQQHFPSFEAMLLWDVMMFALDDMADVVGDSLLDLSDDEADQIICEFATWAIAVKTQLIQRGAQISADYQVNWSHWQ